MKKPPISLLVALVAAMSSGPLFGYGLSAASAAVIEQVGITPGQVGGLASVAFTSAALGSWGLGRLADRIGVRAQLVIIHGAAIVSLVLAAAASRYWLLVLAAAIAGVPLAICNPTTNRIIRHQVPTAQRSIWIGTKQSGVQVAQLFSGLFFPAMTLWLGWTGAALGAAAVIVLALVQGLVVLRPDPGEGHPDREPAGQDQSGGDGGAGIPATVWFLAGIALLSGAGMQATNVYLPLFAVQSLGYGLVVGGLAAVVTGVVGVASRIFWSRRLQLGAEPGSQLTIIFIGAVLSALALLGANLTGVRGLMWIGAVLLGASTLGVSVVVNATILQVVPRTRIGVATGVTSMGMYVGFAAGPIIMGVVRDLTGDFWIGWVIVTGFYLAGLALTLALRTRGSHPMTSSAS